MSGSASVPGAAPAPPTFPLRFDLPGGGRAIFTDRAFGNLSTMRGPGCEHGRLARDRLREELGLHGLFAGLQVHGAVVRRVTAPIDRESDGGGGEAGVAGADRAPIEADGQATALRGVGVMVLVADCLPVVLGSEGAVAALHAGRRGLAAGVLEEGVRALRELGGGGEIAAVIGPGAGPCCYEVGEEVAAVFASSSPAGRRRVGRNLDLPGLARDRLVAAGVARIEDVALCTICDASRFSHRREALRAGRQAAVAWLS